jgi:hypothetical protein
MAIRIRSKRAGFRRCGVAHPSEWTEYPEDAFGEEQLRELRAEPMLQVEVLDAPDGPAMDVQVKTPAVGKEPGPKAKRK